MDILHNDIVKYFGNEPAPSVSNLVVNNGFDELEKEDAVTFYSGKTWMDVLKHLRVLRDEKIVKTSIHLEAWSVLSKESLSYYLRAYLEYLFEDIGRDPPDEEFIVDFVFQLYQVIYMHKGSPFSLDQTIALKRVMAFILENAKDQKRFEYAGHDIIENVKQFLEELGKY